VITPDFIGTLPGWITAASTTTGVAAIIIAFFRRGVSLKGLQNAAEADIRDHYADEVKALREKLDRQEAHFRTLEKHLREMIDASDKRAEESDRRHGECEQARRELRGEIDEMHKELTGLHRQITEQSADKLLILEQRGKPSEVAPHSTAAAKRLKENGGGGK
jgi:predicted RNase H-like nuclease (RuvC/YqgF family)